MVKRNLKFYVMMLISCAAFASCTHSPVIPAEPAVSFSKQVQPVLVANCGMSGCHSSGQSSGEDAFSLTSYSDVMHGDLIVPGNAKASRLYTAINSKGESSMPPAGQLANDDILLIYLWIEQGAKNN